MQIGAAAEESSMELPQKVKNESALRLSDSTSGNLFEQTWNANSKEHKHPYIHCSIIYNHQDMEAAQVSIHRWEDKQLWDIYMMEYYSAVKKENFTFCDSMNGPGEYYAK